ncbi:MAG: hypothetical protein DRO99_00360, partial [Candidatus Aenigmatarchaeota archaeon]
MEENRKKLKKLLDMLGSIRGRHTELVTVYVPSGYNLSKISDQIRQEQSTAQNIKSKSVRKNVMGALEKILQHLKLYKQTPKNGLAIFCGNVSEKEGEADIEIWAIEPPEPVKTKLYWCGQDFILDPLNELFREKEVYGLIVLDKSEAEIGLLSGKKIESLKHMESIVPGKTKKGGWCVHGDSLVQLEDGSIRRIRDVGENRLMCLDLKEFKTVPGKHNHFFKRNSDKSIEIKTIAPTMRLCVTPEHVLFTVGDEGLKEKPARDLRAGDMLISVKNVGFEGKSSIDSGLAQLLGYILGDGSRDKNRINISESDEELAKHYSGIAEKLGINSGIMKRRGKGYYEIKLYSKALLDMVKHDFGGIISPERRITDDVCRFDNKTLSRFMRGLYDAEGWVDRSAKIIGITMNSKDVIEKLRMLLLRFGII